MIRLTHTIPILREIEARVEVAVIDTTDTRSLIETKDGERFWVVTHYLKEIK